MSEPYWVPLSAQPVDYEGAYAAGTQYVPGDVVRYNGIDYLCVNPALGQTPPAALAGNVPLLTALPASPVDGQEVILTDSLTAGTYQWRLRYVAGRASNRWLFVGGPPVFAEIATQEGTASTSFVALATAGPSLVIPVAGDYTVDHGFAMHGSAGGAGGAMSYDIGGVAAVDADSAAAMQQAGTAVDERSVMFSRRKSLGAVTLTAKYRNWNVAGTVTFGKRWMRVWPVAVGG
jgi:hypothetical protein